MKVFVINLPRDKDRRESARRQLGEASVEFEFFTAIDASNGWQGHFEDYDERAFLINTGRVATKGEIGCYASHRALWQRCVDLDEAIMIMEDDFHLTGDFREAYEQSARLITRYGYIRLQLERRGKRRFVKKAGRFDLLYYTKMPHSLMCYSIAPSVARAFLHHSKQLDAPADVMVKKIWEHRQRLFGLSPYPVLDHELADQTSISGRVKPSKPLSIRLARLLTKASWIIRRLLFSCCYRPPT